MRDKRYGRLSLPRTQVVFWGPLGTFVGHVEFPDEESAAEYVCALIDCGEENFGWWPL